MKPQIHLADAQVVLTRHSWIGGEIPEFTDFHHLLNVGGIAGEFPELEQTEMKGARTPAADIVTKSFVSGAALFFQFRFRNDGRYLIVGRRFHVFKNLITILRSGGGGRGLIC